MQYHIVMIPASGTPASQDDLNAFLRGHKVTSVSKALEVVAGSPVWCFCVEWLEGAPVPSAVRGQRSKKIDYKEVLSEDDFATYAKLRDVRKALAEAEAIPVYAVCTNETLADLARQRPKTVAAARKAKGFGEAKAEKYGQALVDAISAADTKSAGGGQAACDGRET